MRIARMCERATESCRTDLRFHVGRPTGAIDRPGVEISIGFGPEVGKEMVAAAALALGAERGQVDRADDDLLAGPGVGLGEDPAVESTTMLPPGQENGG